MNQKIRGTENLHILLWLIKDLCWVQEWKALGTFMFFPTFGVAVWLTFKSRFVKSEFIHNLAVTFWILANTTWMIGEFFFDEYTKPFAAALFVVGLAVLFYYYIPLVFRSLISKTDKSQE